MDNKPRCAWVSNDPIYVQYHDEEWGVEVRDDQKMFEFLLLETFQAGLSWLTILRKRENFRQAFSEFDYRQIAQYSTEYIEELMSNEGIIRNRQKILASINNATRFMEVQQEFGSFCKYLWQFVDNQPLINSPQNPSEVPATTELSDRISKDMKKRGFKFVGSTTIYAHLQASGIVNDHLTSCFRHPEY